MKKLCPTLLLIMVCLVLFFTGSREAPAAKPIELSFVGDYPERHPVVQNAFIPWFKSIEKMSNGKVKIHYYPPNTLVPQKDGYESAISGMIDIFAAPNLYTINRFPELAVLSLPFIAPNAEVGGLVTMAMYNKYPKMRKRFADTKLLWFWSSPLSQLHTTKKLVKTLNDLKGLRIIGFDSAMQKRIKALGANPISLSPPDIYMALQRGTADGVLFPFAPIRAFKISDVAKYHTIIDETAGQFYAVMNKDRFSSLPANIQKMFEETTGEKLCRKVGQVIDQGSANDIKWMKKNGHTIYTLPAKERKKWIKKVSPEIDNILKKEYGNKLPTAKEFYREAQRLGRKIEKTVGR